MPLPPSTRRCLATLTPNLAVHIKGSTISHLESHVASFDICQLAANLIVTSYIACTLPPFDSGSNRSDAWQLILSAAQWAIHSKHRKWVWCFIHTTLWYFLAHFHYVTICSGYCSLWRQQQHRCHLRSSQRSRIISGSTSTRTARSV